MKYLALIVLAFLVSCSARWGIVEMEGSGRAATAASLTQFLVYIEADGTVKGRVIDNEGNVVEWNDAPLEFELADGTEKGWLKEWGSDWRELTPDEITAVRDLAGWSDDGS